MIFRKILNNNRWFRLVAMVGKAADFICCFFAFYGLVLPYYFTY